MRNENRRGRRSRRSEVRVQSSKGRVDGPSFRKSGLSIDETLDDSPSIPWRFCKLLSTTHLFSFPETILAVQHDSFINDAAMQPWQRVGSSCHQFYRTHIKRMPRLGFERTHIDLRQTRVQIMSPCWRETSHARSTRKFKGQSGAFPLPAAFSFDHVWVR